MMRTLPFNRPTVGSLAPIGGFTLLEIMLVLGLIALASVVLLPNVNSLGGRQVDVQVREAISLLNHARRTAVVRGRPSVATFYPGDEADAVEELPIPAANSVGRWFSNGLLLLFEDSAEDRETVTDMLEIGFFPEGGSTGGTLHIGTQDSLTRIQVDFFTGRVSSGRVGS